MKVIEFNTLLVPVDFSDNSKAAVAQAMALAKGDNPVIIILHVIDSALADLAEEHGFGSREKITSRMRENAEQQLAELSEGAPEGIDVETIVSEGRPFLEILKKANDFAVDAVVMNKVGSGGKVEELLFGTTAEKVLRGSSKPVIVLPPVY